MFLKFGRADRTRYGWARAIAPARPATQDTASVRRSPLCGDNIVLYFGDIPDLKDCGVVSKAGWDGLTPLHVEYLPRPVDLVIIQHTVTSTCTNNARCAEIVRAIQTNHMDNLGYWDIASS
uniref:Peptidoglycan recognition protein family domain-containing protein n=1 Tax=Heliothis virescens TaxID=7102 RepID=A0A2A4K5F0_HELVI